MHLHRVLFTVAWDRHVVRTCWSPPSTLPRTATAARHPGLVTPEHLPCRGRSAGDLDSRCDLQCILCTARARGFERACHTPITNCGSGQGIVFGRRIRSGTGMRRAGSGTRNYIFPPRHFPRAGHRMGRNDRTPTATRTHLLRPRIAGGESVDRRTAVRCRRHNLGGRGCRAVRSRHREAPRRSPSVSPRPLEGDAGGREPSPHPQIHARGIIVGSF
jgi:hypothetical protein